MLISVADLQKYTGVLDDDTALQEIFCQSASDIITNYLGYSPELAYRSEYYKGNGKTRLQLRSKPIYYLLFIRSKDKEVTFNERDYRKRYYMREEFIELSEGTFENTNLEIGYISGYGEIETELFKVNGGRADSAFSDILNAGNAATFGGDFYNGGNAPSRLGDININAPLPVIFKQTAMRIAALLQTESRNNIGVSGVSFGESGSRSFVSYTNFDKYLAPLGRYRLLIM
jgi:hypothetical protein